MDCLHARGVVLLSELQSNKQHGKRRVGARSGEPKTFCCSALPSEAAVFTASRLSSSVLRIIGPGSSFLTSGLGSILAFDEFFVHPFHQEENSLGPYQADCLTYFLEEKLEHDFDEESEDKSVKHGIQVSFQMSKKAGGRVFAGNETVKVSHLSPLISKAASVEMLFLENNDNKGGAKVRVVSGQYENISTPVQENFGVGIMKRDASVRPFYENEGHGIWFPPLSDNKSAGSFLHVTCHLWSSLRFLVLEIAIN